MSVSGNRLPYSPKHLLTAGIGYTNRAFSLDPFNAGWEAQCVSDQFGDDRNIVTPTPNGQRGIVRGWCMMNATLNQYMKKINTTFLFVAKNMLDHTTIMDRTRGIYPGLPALWRVGPKWTFYIPDFSSAASPSSGFSEDEGAVPPIRCRLRPLIRLL